jgi:hypothetical protein
MTLCPINKVSLFLYKFPYIKGPILMYLSSYTIVCKRTSNYIVMCRWYTRRKWEVLVRMIGFISTLVTISLNHIQIQRYRWFTRFIIHCCIHTIPLLVTDLNTETITVSLDYTQRVFNKSHVNSSQADLFYSSVRLVPICSVRALPPLLFL